MYKPFKSWKMRLAFASACLIMAWVGLSTYWSTHRLVNSFNSVSDSHKAIEKLQTIQELVQAAETSAYNYVITGREERLAIYENATIRIPRRLGELDTLVKNHPKQRSSMREFRRIYALHREYLNKIVSARKTEGIQAASEWVVAEDAHSIRDVLHQLLSDINSEETRLLKKRSASTSEHSETAKFMLLGAVIMSFLIIAWIFGWLSKESGVRHETEAANRQLETFLRTIVERIPYMVLVKDAANLRITLVNKAATEWLGRSEQELLGSNDYDLRPREDARLATEQDREVLRQGEPVDIPEEILVKDGKEERVLHTQKISIPDESGFPAFLLTISEDITLRKQAERQLAASRDSAVQSERLKSEFIRNMSHEIRTPLSIVVGMTSILQESHLPADLKGFVDKAVNASNALTRLTKSILDFSRIEAGTFALEIQEMSIRQNIEGVLSMLTEQAKTKGVSLVGLIPPAIPAMVMGDPFRFRQVLTEFVTNAMKFTAKGEILVRVSEAEQVDHQYWVTIKVSDTGVGIDEEVQKHIFEPFRQGDGSPTRRYGGTGLGLAMCKRIVELMGGKIGFSSGVKEGSTFWFTVPFERRGAAPKLPKASVEPWAKARILIVNEDDIARRTLREQLTAWQLTSEGVSRAETALHLLRKEHKAGRPFQIVLIDMHLTDMESATFARMVQTDPELKGVRLIVLNDTPMEQTTVTALGFEACIAKSAKLDTLYECLLRMIDTPTERRSSAA